MKLFVRSLRLSAGPFAVLAMLASTPGPASAEIGLKKLVIRDCQKAKEGIAALSDAEKPEFIQFLSLLLKRRPTTPARTPVAPVSLPGHSNPFESPLDETASGELFQFLDPTHETDAKLCALGALDTLVPYSFEAIPAMLEISADVSVASTVRDQIASTLAHITAASFRIDGFSAPPGVVRYAVEGLASPYKKLAENFLIELGSASFPYLIDAIRRPDGGRRNRIQRMFFLVDQRGEAAGPVIAGLFSSGDMDLRMRAAAMLGKLPAYAPASVPKLLETLHDLSTEVQDASIRALTELIPAYGQSEALVRDVFHAGLDLLKRRSEKLRGTPQLLLEALFPDYAAAQRELSAALSSREEDLVFRVVQILSGKVVELSDETSQALLKLLPKASERVTESALSLLAKTKSAKSTLDAIVVLVLTKGKGTLTSTREKTALEGLRTVARLPVMPEAGKKLVPVGISLIPLNGDIDESFLSAHPAALFLRKYGKDALQPLLKKSSEADSQSVGVLRLLSAISPSAQTVVNAAIERLKDEEPRVRQAAESALIAAGKAATGPLEKLLKSKDPNVRFSAAKVLGSLDSKNPLILPSLVEDLSSKGCADIGGIIPVITKVQNGVSGQLFSKFLSCIQANEISLDTFSTVAQRLGPLPNEAKVLLLDLIRSPQTDKFLKLKIIELARAVELPPVEVGGILVDLAGSGDSALALVSLGALHALGIQAAGTAPRLMAIANNRDLELLIRNEAALVVSQSAPEQDSFVDYFVDELKGENSDWAIKTISRMDPGQMKKVLSKAYDAVSGDNRRHVIRLIASLPHAEAVSFTDRLLILLNTTKVSDTRFNALVTLLKIDPALPELAQPLRAELLNTNREELLAEHFAPDIRPLLSSLIPQAQTRLEKLGLETMLENIGSASAPGAQTAHVI